MKLFCQIETSLGTKHITKGPCPLPECTETISGFNKITDLRVLKKYGWLPYNKVIDNKPIVTGSNIIILDDVVQETFFTRDETSEEKENKVWLEIRKKRDFLLKETDVLVLVDRWEKTPVIEKEKISTYRQALRDLPQTYGNPHDVIWPEKV